MEKKVLNKNKKAAIEMSIGTIVIIVLAMTMLILGLILVRTIFKTSTESVDTLSDKIQNEITGLFTDEGADVIVKLGADQTAVVKPDTDNFGIAIGARTLDGSAASNDRLKYKLTLEQTGTNNCFAILGKAKTESLFITSLNTLLSFDQIKGSNVFARVQVKVPKGTAICTQKAFIDVVDTKDNSDVGRNFFILEVAKAGFF